MKTASSNPLVKIPRGWRELRAGARIGCNDRQITFNQAPFRNVGHRIWGQTYIKHMPGGHWTVIRRIPA